MTLRDSIKERLEQNDTLLVWEDDYDRLADLAVWATRDLIDELISTTDQTQDLKCCKTRKKTLIEIREMLE